MLNILLLSTSSIRLSALFAESEGELVDIEILDNLTPNEVMEIINPKLPDGAQVIEVKEVERYAIAVDICAHWAEYKITPYFKSNEAELYNFEKIRYDIERVLSSKYFLKKKKNKKGLEKTTDFKKFIKFIDLLKKIVCSYILKPVKVQKYLRLEQIV